MNINDVGFIDPHVINGYVLKQHPKDVESDLYMFLTKQQLKSPIDQLTCEGVAKGPLV